MKRDVVVPDLILSGFRVRSGPTRSLTLTLTPGRTDSTQKVFRGFSVHSVVVVVGEDGGGEGTKYVKSEVGRRA